MAVAETAGCDIIFTTDDKFLRRARNISPRRIQVENPAKWALEQWTV